MVRIVACFSTATFWVVPAKRDVEVVALVAFLAFSCLVVYAGICVLFPGWACAFQWGPFGLGFGLFIGLFALFALAFSLFGFVWLLFGWSDDSVPERAISST